VDADKYEKAAQASSTASATTVRGWEQSPRQGMAIPANIQLARSDSKATRILRSALRCAERGWPIFPLWPRHGEKCACGDTDCKGPGKHPIGRLVPNGFKDATTDQEAISRWWREYPDAGIGMPTGSKSGLIVIDIDVKKGKDGTVALAVC